MSNQPSIAAARIARKPARCPRCIQWLVRRFGMVVIPIAEINWMEQDGIDGYRSMKMDDLGIKDYGYANGIADYTSKKSKQLREKYLP